MYWQQMQSQSIIVTQITRSLIILLLAYHHHRIKVYIRIVGHTQRQSACHLSYKLTSENVLLRIRIVVKHIKNSSDSFASKNRVIYILSTHCSTKLFLKNWNVFHFCLDCGMCGKNSLSFLYKKNCVDYLIWKSRLSTRKSVSKNRGWTQTQIQNETKR